MQTYISPEDSLKIEKAINFLVIKYSESGKNPKPVVIHSIRVGINLSELGYDTNIAIVGILHDLVEDSDVTLEDISNEFNIDISNWVSAVSFNPEIKDPVTKYQEMFSRTIAGGRIPVVVKAADLFSNMPYYKLVSDPSKQKLLMEKVSYFLNNTQAFNTEPAIIQLQKQYQELSLNSN